MFHDFPVSHRSDIFVLAIDVDLTLVDSLSTWVKATGLEITIQDLPEPEIDQVLDLAPWFEQKGVKDPLSYWKGADVYDGMRVNRSFVDFYQTLCFWLEKKLEKRVETIVVSSCFPEHENSKRQLVKSVFGERAPFISTSAKHMVDFDLIIDDSMGVAFNCISAGKNVLHAPSPLARPSIGTKLNKHFFHPGYDGKSWPYNWLHVSAEDLVKDLLKISNK